MAETTDNTAHSSTEQNIALLASKRDRLNLRLSEAFEQYAAEVARSWKRRDLDWHGLKRAYKVGRRESIPNAPVIWKAAGLPSINKITHMLLHQPDTDVGFWHGSYPWGPRDLIPNRGENVVYVLFTEDLEPCYVGSTRWFAERARDHRRDGKTWSYWIAYPCRDREEAYQMEERFLQQYLPGLNKRAGR